MFLIPNETIGCPDQCYLAGTIYEVPDNIGTHWIRSGYAKRTTQPPEVIANMLARLDIGAGEKALFLPYLGEFGHRILTGIRLVHWNKAKYKIVCCRRGQEVLYPSANEYDYDWEDVPDKVKIGSCREEKQPDWAEIKARHPDAIPIISGSLSPTQELFCIEPGKRIPFRPKLRGLKADCILGVRHRDIFPARNWKHWQRVADALAAHGITYAVNGDLGTSYGLHGQSWHSGTLDTDAAIEGLQNCRLYVGTDSGGSHLAATVGCPMVVFRLNNGDRDLIPNMLERNRDILALPPNAWNHPELVIAAILNRLCESEN